MNARMKIVLPLAIVLISMVLAVLIVQARPVASRVEAEAPLPMVRVLRAEPATLRLDVRSQGTVTPQQETVLVAEVPGKVIAIAPQFATGGAFRQGEVLVRLDPSDFELAAAQAQSSIAQARVRLERERAEAAVARQEWDELGRGTPTPLASRLPQLAEAEAAVKAAEASLAQARLNVSRSVVRAPFAGRILEKRVDLGQYLSPGTPVARIFSADFVEVELPVPHDQLAYLDLSSTFSGGPGPSVRLRSQFAGVSQEWPARIVRTSGSIDPATRMMGLIARVERPFTPPAAGGYPLQIGQFVEAEIEGRTVENIYAVPRGALRGRDQLIVIDADQRIRFRTVEIMRLTSESALVAHGLNRGDLVLVSQLESPVEGARVRLQEDVTTETAIEREAR
jgi:membrane fusion protein, multidrug efflux system